MASRTISRLLLVLALIVAAHAFKPISSRSIVEQLLSAAESLSFVLPDVAEVRIAQAGYLANAFTQGTRKEADSRLTEEPATAMPAVLAFGQSLEAATCDQRVVAKSLHRPVFIGKAQARLKPLIPDLPRAMPLSRAMSIAMTLPATNYELISMPLPRSNRRSILVPVAIRAVMRPTARKAIKPAACESTVIIASESEAEFGPQEGPHEELDDMISELGFSDDASDVEDATDAPEATGTPVPSQSPLPANCTTVFPGALVPTGFGTPRE